MAKTPERTVELMEAVWKRAVQRCREEVADMQAIGNKEKPGIRGGAGSAGEGRSPKGAAPIEPWDYRFYAEKVRKAKYDLDENDVKPYLQLEKLREGMFWVAGQLFGFKFMPVADGSVPVYQSDVRVWEVQDQDGRHLGLWYFDPYARPGKNSGAWMNEYRPQSHLLDQPVIVSNNANFVKGKDGEPILISWDDADTLFHEFGHALHGLNSNVTYPQLAGTNVPRDYVEFPSQLLERWLSTRQALDQFALHFQTGQPVPADLVKKIERTETFNQGFKTVEYLSSALVDMKLHLAKEPTADPRQFEKDTLAALGMPREIVMRHRTAQFHHIFADGYEAGYYSYLWSDTLSTDAYEAFLEASGPYDKAVAKRRHRLGAGIDSQLRDGDHRGALLAAAGRPAEHAPRRLVRGRRAAGGAHMPTPAALAAARTRQPSRASASPGRPGPAARCHAQREYDAAPRRSDRSGAVRGFASVRRRSGRNPAHCDGSRDRSLLRRFQARG